MVLLRDQVRVIALREAGFEHPGRVAAQWGPFAVFVVLLVAGVATIAVMARRSPAGLLEWADDATPPPAAFSSRPRRARALRVPARGGSRREAVPARREGRRGRRGGPRGHDRPRGHPRLHARDDDAVRRPPEGRAPAAARGTAETGSPPRSWRSDSRYWLEDLVVARKGAPDPGAAPGRQGPRAAAGRRHAGRGPRGPGRPAASPFRSAGEGRGGDVRLHPLSRCPTSARC